MWYHYAICPHPTPSPSSVLCNFTMLLFFILTMQEVNPEVLDEARSYYMGLLDENGDGKLDVNEVSVPHKNTHAHIGTHSHTTKLPYYNYDVCKYLGSMRYQIAIDQ